MQYSRMQPSGRGSGARGASGRRQVPVFLTHHHRRRSSTSDCPPDSVDSHSDRLLLPIKHSRARTEHPTTNYHHPLRNIDLAPDLDDTGVTRPRLNRIVNEASSSSSADEETEEHIVSPLRLVSPSASSPSSKLENERLVLVHEVGVRAFLRFGAHSMYLLGFILRLSSRRRS